jgi:hypothetical protein
MMQPEPFVLFVNTFVTFVVKRSPSLTTKVTKVFTNGSKKD